MTEKKPIITIRNLNLHLDKDHRDVHILKDVNHTIYPGEIWGIAGESGAGKSMTMYAMLSLLPEKRTTLTGNINYLEADGSYTDLLTMPFDKRNRYCADKVSIILQDSINALNPFERIETQWTETGRPEAHRTEVGRNPGNMRYCGLRESILLSDWDTVRRMKDFTARCWRNMQAARMRKRRASGSIMTRGTGIITQYWFTRSRVPPG